MSNSDRQTEHSSVSRWIVKHRDDESFAVNHSPQRLDLHDAANWIKKNRPIPFLGSAFSIPAPSSLPSGTQLSRVLYQLICPNLSAGNTGEELFSKFLHRWPLERLFDLTRRVGLNCADSLLEWCRVRASTAQPNELHHSISRYIQHYNINRIETTNWDSLIEMSLNDHRIPYVVYGIPELYGDGMQPESPVADNTVIVNHCHGAFHTGDVVCSQREEALMPSKFLRREESFLFLGYSGYEPSMYSFLIRAGNSGALWCVHKEEDLLNPLKSRICCGANTYVFVGDLQALLSKIECLDQPIEMKAAILDDLRLASSIDSQTSSIIESIILPTIAPLDIKELLASLNASKTAEEFLLRVEFVSKFIGSQVRAEISDTSLDWAIEILLTQSHQILCSSHIWDELVLWHIGRTFRKSGRVTATQVSELNRIWSTPAETFGSFQSIVKMQAFGYGVVMAPVFDGHDPNKPVYGYAEALGDIELVADLAELYARSILKSESYRAIAILHSAAGNYFMAGNLMAGQRVTQLIRRIESGI